MLQYRLMTDEIKKYAPKVMRDRNARIKNRVIAAIAMLNVELAVKLCKIIYRHRS